MTALRTLELTPHLGPAFGGVASSLPPFCRALQSAGAEPRIAAFCKREERWGEQTCPATRFSSGPIPGKRTRARLLRMMAESDAVHIHGLWQVHCRIGSDLARKLKRPYVISAHGMLQPWALSKNQKKKAIYSALFEKRNLLDAACLRALTSAEVDDYRRFGLPNPVAVVPNGVLAPEPAAHGLFLERFPTLRNKRLLVFLGRIHEKKGIEPLCRAWARIANRFPDAALVVAGPDDDGTLARIERLLPSLGLTGRVIVAGMLEGILKWSLLSAADWFVLPSFSEGFSIATLEALAVGVPVIITPQCQFPEVQERSCGLLTSPIADSIEEVLISALETAESRRQVMGAEGRKLVRNHYDWLTISERMLEVYKWICGGPKPILTHLHLT